MDDMANAVYVGPCRCGGYGVLYNETYQLERGRCHRPLTETADAHTVMQDDVAELLRALELSDHARTESPHQVLQREVLPAIRRLRAAVQPDAPLPDVRTALWGQDNGPAVPTNADGLLPDGAQPQEPLGQIKQGLSQSWEESEEESTPP